MFPGRIKLNCASSTQPDGVLRVSGNGSWTVQNEGLRETNESVACRN